MSHVLSSNHLFPYFVPYYPVYYAMATLGRLTTLNSRPLDILIIIAEIIAIGN